MSISQRGVLFVSIMTAALPSSFGNSAASAAEAIHPRIGEEAAVIREVSGVQGGIVVHLGCADGRLTAALRADDAYTVQGWTTDSAAVPAIRKRLSQMECYGDVSIHALDSNELPYADDLVNLIVVSQPELVPKTEMFRILAPGGVLCTKEDDIWHTETKRWPDNIDQWTHYLHDASGNAVAQDELVGPPRALQWIAPPLWLRSHETPSGFESLVSGNGRVFYYLDEGLIGITDQRLPERWSLVCRDAFNGRLLWKRPIEGWGWPAWAQSRFAEQDWTTIRGGRTVVPEENQRRLVVDGDRLFATLSYQAPVSILDAASGTVLKTVEETAPVKELLVAKQTLVVYSQNSEAATSASRRGQEPDQPSQLFGIDPQTGNILWQRAAPNIGSLMLAIDGDRLVYRAGSQLTCLGLLDGQWKWQVDHLRGRPRTLIAIDGTVIQYTQQRIEAHDIANGQLLWSQDQIPPSSGGESPDLFVIGDQVWRGIVPVDDQQKPVKKSEDAMVVAYDLRTGKPTRRVVVDKLRSPEHHHRCYRNKATQRYIISGMEGAEFLDLRGEDHCQNNWLRGACKLGVMPSNGLLYVPPDQCFCQPGAKILGLVAAAAERPQRQRRVADEQRLSRGPAYGQPTEDFVAATQADWPTYRQNSSRHATTPTSVSPEVKLAWSRQLGERLTQPVVCGDRLLVAAPDAHRITALDPTNGQPIWDYIVGARIDSPPTIYQDKVLLGSADGHVYCLRARDGELVWRYLAAPQHRWIGHFDQLESVWPVHGSILVHDGLAYCTAGRSTYLDGGIRVLALDPHSGCLQHETVLAGPLPDVKQQQRDEAFYLTGANSDVLVQEGNHIYMRQKKLTPDLREVDIPVLSSKGAQDVGLHLFSTASLLDGSWYNRTFWMYAQRWPGFQLANQASKTGQLMVVDEERTYALRVFYRRNVHSPMFFPGKEGYLLFADENTNEPQIVGDEGWRPPVEWLPQSHIPREGNPGLDSVSRGFGADKGIGYTRAEPPRWTRWTPIRARGMVKAGDVLFVAGPPDIIDQTDPYAAFEGRRAARLAAIDARDGTLLAELPLSTSPVFDGMIAARGRLFASLENGTIVCLE